MSEVICVPAGNIPKTHRLWHVPCRIFSTRPLAHITSLFISLHLIFVSCFPPSHARISPPLCALFSELIRFSFFNLHSDSVFSHIFIIVPLSSSLFFLGSLSESILFFIVASTCNLLLVARSRRTCRHFHSFS